MIRGLLEAAREVQREELMKKVAAELYAAVFIRQQHLADRPQFY
jgi:hypothetical protein